MISLLQLQTIMPSSKARALLFLGPLNAAMLEFDINTPVRQAMFLAQVGHESGQLQYMEEIASGAAYDNRADLGNTNPVAVEIARKHGSTPGRFWKGHGPIQVTGYYNHLEMMVALDIDCVENPLLLTQPEYGFRAAGHFWRSRGLNSLADKGEFITITKRINGGTNGLADRQALFARAGKVLL